MKVATDLSVTSVLGRGMHGPAMAWGTPWAAPLSGTLPALVMDFQAARYGIAGSPLDLDDVLAFQRASAATHFDASGNFVSAAADVPRLSFDPVTQAPEGLLLEPGTANLIAGSDAPAGQTIAVTAEPHVLSFFGTGDVDMFGAQMETVIGDGTFPQRRVLKFTPAAGDLELTFIGDVTRAQLEVGETATSYVSGSRADDLASAGLAGWFNNVAGTVVFGGQVLGAANNDRIVEIDNGSSGSRVSILWNTVLEKPQLQVWDAGVLQAAIAPSGNAIGLGQDCRVAIAYGPNDFAISVNGSPVVGDTAGTVPGGLIALRLGRALSGAQGAILTERLVYFASRLSDTELQELST